jgi:hypothetical protein
MDRLPKIDPPKALSALLLVVGLATLLPNGEVLIAGGQTAPQHGTEIFQ